MAATGALAVVQARTSSSRLPGKVLADIEGEPMLALLLRRLGRAARVARIVVATSDDPSDDAVERVTASVGVATHRGPLDDVLRRYVGAVGRDPGPVVRITGDCPLIDPGLVDATVERFAATPGARYASNIEPRTFPDGLDVEVFSVDALRDADRLAGGSAEREHVTTVMRGRPDLFPPASLTGPEPLGDLRWTVDDRADLDFVRAVVARLGERRHEASMHDILAAVRRDPPLRSAGALRG